MHNRTGFGGRNTRVPDNMDHRNKFAIVTSHAAVCREFAGPERRYERAGAFHAGIAVGGVGCDELIGAAFPVLRWQEI
jgi:hypothetical protein